MISFPIHFFLIAIFSKFRECDLYVYEFTYIAFQHAHTYTHTHSYIEITFVYLLLVSRRKLFRVFVFVSWAKYCVTISSHTHRVHMQYPKERKLRFMTRVPFTHAPFPPGTNPVPGLKLSFLCDTHSSITLGVCVCVYSVEMVPSGRIYCKCPFITVI